MHTNAEILTAVMTRWLKPMGSAVFDMILGQKMEGINEWAKKIFPLPANYSIKDDLGFLLKPSVDMMVAPYVRNLLQQSGVDDAHIPEYAHRLVKAMSDECMRKGNITLFDSIVINMDDVNHLCDLLEKNLPDSEETDYVVVE